ncbi:hypothetical protein N7509_013841 [Penicillium cosmopolitanum]|uniref:Uncharacterized protein n=1 Tax=Penicillium cosmopolitanum TaxID=1131564 RepID=A0A9W9SEJ2_9EURO|nr:uncharacterized protein N7509_013841 [Penicillium cosmopolitanum]KAJ5376955.1 hypothetical protein N7509_013841 [Penicillium cosmopolitanum]
MTPMRIHIQVEIFAESVLKLVLGTPNSSDGPVNWDIHSRALAALLRSRGRKQFKTKTGRQLFQLAYNYIQIQSFQPEIGPPPEAEEWLQIVQSELDANDFIYLKSFCYGNEASRICKDAKLFFELACSTEEKLTAIENAFQSYYDIKTSIHSASEALVGSHSSDTTTILATKKRSIIPLLGIQNHLDAFSQTFPTKQPHE